MPYVTHVDITGENVDQGANRIVATITKANTTITEILPNN